MSQQISIKRKDGTKINMNGDGNVWHITEKSGGPCLGYIVNHVVNVSKLYGLHEATKDKYVPVNRLILKYAGTLRIKRLRIQLDKTIKTDVGNRVIIRYGYVNSDKFDYLLEHRKMVSLGMTTDKAVLLRKTDLSIERH